MSEAIEKDWTDGQNGDKNGMRTLTKECGQPLYVGKSKKVNFTLDRSDSSSPGSKCRGPGAKWTV